MTLLHLLQRHRFLQRHRNDRDRAKSPLRLILTVPFVLLTVGTTGLVGFLCVRDGQQAVEDLAHQLMAETGDRVNLYLTDYLKTPQLINRLNANAVRLNQIDITSPGSLQRHFIQQIQAFDSVSRIHFSNPQGGYLSTGNDERGLSVATTPNFVSGTLQVYSVDPQGNRRKRLVERPDYDSRQRPFYQEAVEAGKPVWTPIYVYVPASRGLGISASYPLYNEQRQLQGVLSSDLTLTAISQFLAKLRVGTNGTVFIVDRSGLLVASSTPEKPFFTPTNSNQTERLKAIESQETPIRLASQYLAAELGDLNQIKSPTQLQFDIEGQRQFLQVMPFQDDSGLDWLIAVTVPESSFMERIHSNTQDTLILGGAALIGSILLGLWVARWIAKPIQQISRASASLAAGEWQEPLQEDSPIAEIQVLVHALNQNAAQLQQSFDRIKTALAESEEKFTTIFRISPEPIAIANFADGCMLEVNESAMRFYGYSEAEIIGKTALQLNFWHNLEQREQYRTLLEQQGNVRNLEVQVRTKSGEVKTVLMSAESCLLEGQNRIIVTHRDITERKAIELALQQSEARYRAIVEDQTELVCRSLPDTTVTFVNDACCRYFGVNREDMIGKSYRHLIYEPDRAEVERNIDSLSIDQPIITSENRWVVNGEVRWMQWSDRLLFDRQGNATEIQSVGRDITHLKQAEEALRQSEERNRAILSAMPDLMTVISAEGIYRDIVRSNSLVDLIPLDVNPIGKHLTEFVPPDIAAIKLQLIQQTLETGEMQTLEQRLWLGDRWQYEEVRSVPCGHDAALIMIRDITDRKQAEIALQQSENRFQQLASASPVVIYTLVEDVNGRPRFEYISPAFETLHEIPIAVALQDAGVVAAQVHPDDRVSHRQAIARSIATMQPFQHEWRTITPSGKLKWVQANSQPQRRGDEIVWHGMIQDVTERKQADVKIQQLNQQLSDRVDELQTLFKVLPIGVAISEDPACQITRINPALAQLLRISIDANGFPTAPTANRIAPSPQAERPAYKVYRDGQELANEDLPMQYVSAHNLEIRNETVDIVHSDGTVINLLCYAAPLRDEQGKVRGSIGGFIDISDRKQTEIALQESEARFQEIAQTISQIFFVLDLTTNQYLYISPSYERLWSYSCESLYRDPKSWLDRVHPEDLEYVLSGFDHIPDDNRNLQEYRMIDANGKIHWIRAESWIVRDENGNPIREVGLADDITDRKQLEHTLRLQAEEEHLLATITQNMRQSLDLQQILATTVREVQQTLKVDRVLIFRLHPDGSGQVIQEAVVPAYPVTDQMRWEDEHFPAECYEFYRQGNPRIVLDVAADPWADYLTEFMHSVGVKSKIVAPIVQSCGETAIVWGLLIVHACADRRQWQQSEADLLQQICNQLTIAIDQANLYQQLQTELAERKQVEEALRRNEARIQQVADASPAIIYTIEEYPDGPVRFEFLSPGFEEVHEVPVADVLDNPALAFSCFHPDDREGYRQAVARAAAAMQPFQHTWRIIPPSGKIKWLQGSSRPDRQPDGTLVWHGVILDITELKQAEEALRQSEAALRRAQQVAHVGSWQVEVQTGKVTWTEESFHIMGWDISQPEPSLLRFYELIHPDDRNLLRQKVEFVIAHQIPYKVEFRVLHPDGSLRYVEARGDAVVNEEGHTTHVIGTNLDITERKQAEEALRNSEATKNQILKAIPDLILWMTADGACIDLIEGNSITNLYTKSEAVGKNLYEILPFDLAQARVKAIQQALETGEVQIYEQQVVLESEICYEEVRVIGVGDDRVLVIVRNITDRKRAEAALLDSETRFRRAFSDAPIGMALIGLDDQWIKVNPMLCDMLDFSETELLSKTASSLVHPEDLNKLQQCIQQVLSSENRNAQIELRYCCQQGQIIWGLMSLSLVRDGQGKPLYYVAQIQDITERQAIDRMKNEFISIVSHELRTPLTAIRGFLGLLDTGIYDKKPEKAKHMIGQALSNSDRLVRLVNDILDLERLSSGKIQLIKEACSAEELMQRAAAGVQSLADQANVRLITVPTTAQAWADADCIIQTLTNLLSNAIKFSPPYSAITLSAQTRTDAVLFSVQDQGRGIPADKLEAIFGRFQQVDVSDSRQKGGTGLGLAICQSIVQQHGGSIWAESILGNGSTFYFTLPLMPEGER